MRVGAVAGSARLNRAGRLCVVWALLVVLPFLVVGAVSASGRLAVAPAGSAPFVELGSVSCPSSRACTAVGTWHASSRDGAGVPVSEHWNGRVWSVSQLQLSPTYRDFAFASLSCASGRDCFAVGGALISPPGCGCTAGVSLVERWAHGAWSFEQVPVPRASPGDVGLGDISCSSATRCTIVGGVDSPTRSFVDRWNGSRWSRQLTANRGRGVLEQISCPTPHGCMAVGMQTFDYGGLSELWNGSTWQRRSFPSRGYLEQDLGGGTIDDLSCASMTACIATGEYSTYCSSALPPACKEGRLIWRWDGSRWSLHTAPEGATRKVSCPSQTSCFAVGGSELQHWDGKRWSNQPGRLHPGGAFVRKDVSCSSAIACMAVGTRQIRTPGATIPAPLAWRWNGNKWVDARPANPRGI